MKEELLELKVLKEVEVKDTVPWKSTRKGVVVSLQGISVLGLLVGVMSILREKGWVFWPPEMDEVIIMTIHVPLLAVVHGVVKRIAHLTGVTINFPGVTK